MKTPTERAAQLWCRPEFSNREMDAAFAAAIAEEIEEAEDIARAAGRAEGAEEQRERDARYLKTRDYAFCDEEAFANVLANEILAQAIREQGEDSKNEVPKP